MSQDHGIIPTVIHYGCLVDLLGCAVHLGEAEIVIIKNMPLEADAAVWGALVGACRLHGNLKLAQCDAECSLKIKPQNATAYVLLAHIYAAAGMSEIMAKVRKLMKDRSVKKQRGRSWIEVDKEVHAFVADDRSNSEMEEIYSEIKSLSDQEEQECGVCACHEMGNEEHVRSWPLHMEHPLEHQFVSPRTLVYGNCHSATKFITKIV